MSAGEVAFPHPRPTRLPARASPSGKQAKPRRRLAPLTLDIPFGAETKTAVRFSGTRTKCPFHDNRPAIERTHVRCGIWSEARNYAPFGDRRRRYDWAVVPGIRRGMLLSRLVRFAAGMHIDHINGIGNDHRLENLHMLCPNCHSQTETYAGRNAKRRRRLQDPGSAV